MAPMTPQTHTDESWTEAEAMRLVRRLSGVGKRQMASATETPQTRQANATQQRQDVLLRTFEDEVIPRLLMARRPHQAALAAGVIDQDQKQQVDNLVALLLKSDQATTNEFVETLHDAGTPVELLLLDLLSPAARVLGQMWEDDTCTFSDVTIGILRLGNVLRLLSRAFAGDFEPNSSLPSILLVQVPGEQHGFRPCHGHAVFPPRLLERAPAAECHKCGTRSPGCQELVWRGRHFGGVQRASRIAGGRHSCRAQALTQQGHRHHGRWPSVYRASPTCLHGGR